MVFVRTLWVCTVRNTIGGGNFEWLINKEDYERQNKINEGIVDLEKWLKGDVNKHMPFSPSQHDQLCFDKYLEWKNKQT